MLNHRTTLVIAVAALAVTLAVAGPEKGALHPEAPDELKQMGRRMIPVVSMGSP